MKVVIKALSGPRLIQLVLGYLLAVECAVIVCFAINIHSINVAMMRDVIKLFIETFAVVALSAWLPFWLFSVVTMKIVANRAIALTTGACMAALILDPLFAYLFMAITADDTGSVVNMSIRFEPWVVGFGFVAGVVFWLTTKPRPLPGRETT